MKTYLKSGIISFIILFIFLKIQVSLSVGQTGRYLSMGKNQSEEFSTIRPGDAIQILVYPDTTSFLHSIFRVDGEGNIFLPVVGKVRVTDMSEQEFIQFIKDNFSNYLKGPTLQVRHLIGLSLLGGFNRPGMYYIDQNFTLWQLIQMAGGTVHENGLKTMRWERSKKVINDDLITYIQSGQSLKNIGMKSGDQIWTKTPGQPGILQKSTQIVLPFVSVAVSVYTLYLTYYLISTGSR